MLPLNQKRTTANATGWLSGTFAIVLLLGGCGSKESSETQAPSSGGAQPAALAGVQGGAASVPVAGNQPTQPQGTGNQGPDMAGRPGTDTPIDCAEEEPIPRCDGELLPCTPQAGSNGATRLIGTVVTPSEVFCNGEVIIDRNTGLIECAGESCAGHEKAAEASVICADLILPGIIDPHNHMSYNTLPPWQTDRVFANRGQWRGPLARELYDARLRNDKIAARYNELRLILSGTTSVHKAEGQDSAYDHVRNLDRGPSSNGLGYTDDAFEECVDPLSERCFGAPNYTDDENIPDRIYVAPVAEGVDESSRKEFDTFRDKGQLGPRTSIIHCVACTSDQFRDMRAAGAHLIWSPRSNLELYGATTNVMTAMRMGITVSLGPDWTPSGSMNQLEEMRCAQALSQRYWAGLITNRDLVEMVTSKAAESMGVDDLLGQLSPGFRADVIAIQGDRKTPYDSIVAANPSRVEAVFIGGALYYGNAAHFDNSIQRNDLCEDVDICGQAKKLCVRDQAPGSGTSAPSWATVNYREVIQHVTDEIQEKKPFDLPESLAYVYKPFPLFRCEDPAPCMITREGFTGTAGTNDDDNDGVDNGADNCPTAHNPAQSDLDNDGLGDSCDPCPWAVEECPCVAPLGPDADGDGVEGDADNCPKVANETQADVDGDGIGDACDQCPMIAATPNDGCQISIPAVKTKTYQDGQLLAIEGVVTAVVPPEAGSIAGSFFMETALNARANSQELNHGIFVFLGNRNTVSQPSLGQRVRVHGQPSDFFGQTQFSSISKIDLLGEEPAIMPETIEVSQVNANASGYEGMLLCIGPTTVVDANPEPGPGDDDPGMTFEFLVQVEGTDAQLRVNDLFYRANPFVEEGQSIRQICGVLRFANQTYKLEPRSRAELVLGSPFVRAFSASEGFVRVGPSGPVNDSRGAPVTLELSGPADDAGQRVELTTSAPAALDVEQSVLVPANTQSVVVQARGLQASDNIIVTGRTVEQRTGKTLTVRVFDANASPSQLLFPANQIQLGVGQQANLLVQFDAPTTLATPLTSSVAAQGIVTVAASTPVPVNVLAQEIALTGVAEGQTQLTVRYGNLMATLPVTVSATAATLVLNEVNFDMTGVENQEFIEIFNPTLAPVQLANWSLELVNGTNGQAYKTIDLSPGMSIAANSYVIVGDVGVRASLPATTVFIDLVSSGNDHDIQNGPSDGLRLLQGDEVIDALSYAGTIDGLTEGPSGAPDEPDDDAGSGIGRCPNGVDTNDNGADFVLQPTSPGTANVCN
ncbi:MAG: amidohydrolase family protein [Myxococcota bacterium]|nr:amidohydrolase family protein [Myxococcota bacterium]